MTNALRKSLILPLLVLQTVLLPALPVVLGEVEIGLESYDGYQEGMAYLSTDENGEELEILIAYKGFGLDDVTWTFSADDFTAMRDAAARAAWWRSRLLEIDVDQTVLRDISSVNPGLSYRYRGTAFPFAATEDKLRFLRQGRDYALILTEVNPGAETRRSGEKTLPVFTLHFRGRMLTVLRDMISEAAVADVLAAYAEQKSAIETILAASP